MLNIEYIAIGDEVLTGHTINTNAAYICRELFKHGFRPRRQTTLPDHSDFLEKGVREALSRSDVVICTGGLGPTCDDNTRKTAARLFEMPLCYREEAAAPLRRRYGDSLPSLEDQATLPEKALLFPNPVGTAYGLALTNSQETLILLPGVPYEMKAIFQESVLPYLHERFGAAHGMETAIVHFFDLTESAVDPEMRSLQAAFPDLEFGIYPSLGHVSVVIRCFSKDRRHLHEARERIKEAFASHFFESSSGQLEEAVHHQLIQKKKTLSLAESCTGGALAAAFTQYPGASNYFLGSLVAYSNPVKAELLHVDSSLLQARGAVSGEVAAEMAENILRLTGSDYALSVTGLAGPDGGTDEKPVGTVWFGFAEKGKAAEAWKVHLRGNREKIIHRAVQVALARLWRTLSTIDLFRN